MSELTGNPVKVCNIIIGEQPMDAGWDQVDTLSIMIYQVALNETLRHWANLPRTGLIDVGLDFEKGVIDFSDQAETWSKQKDLLDFLCFAKQHA